MKSNTLAILAILIVIFASGCVRRVPVYVPSLPAGATPQQKKAAEKAAVEAQKRKEVNDKFWGSQPQWKADLGLRCRSQEEYDRVVISWRASHQSTAGWRLHAAVTTFNNTASAVDIMEVGFRGPPVIENFCRGGSITLIRTIASGYGAETVAWMARSMRENFFSQSPTFQLQRSYGGFGGYQQNKEIASWCIGGCPTR